MEIPLRLTGVIGQIKPCRQLEAEAAAGRLAHAYLFVGPAGVGRGSTARALFMALNCEAGGDEACGACGPCRRALAWQHEDLVVVEPPTGAASAQIKVEAVREMIRAMSFPPYGGGVRLVLIRRAENLNPASVGALLKSLEEPPPRNIIVLTVQDPKEIAPTLVSRCRRVNFGPLDEATIAQALAADGQPEEAARLKAAMSGGSLGRAQALDAEALAEQLSRLEAHLASPAGPLEDLALAEELVRGFRGETIDRQGLAEALDLWAAWLRDRAVAAAGQPDLALLGGRAGGQPGRGLGAALAGFKLVRQAQRQIVGNAAPELAVAVLLMELRRAGQKEAA